MRLPEAFKKFLEEINPKQADYNRASQAHSHVRQYLREVYGQAHLDDFLSGSYRRQTVLRGVKDVDIIHTQKLDTSQAPGRALGLLLRRLRAKYGDENSWPQGRSVGLRYNGVDLDIVPAVPAYGTTEDPLLIPDREAQLWVWSHPKGQIKASEDRNRLNNLYKPVVKAVKHWRNLHLAENVRPNSYLVEVLVYNHIPQSRYEADAIQAVLRGIQGFLKAYVDLGQVPNISDPGLPAVNVAKRWTLKEAQTFLAEIEKAVDLIDEAIAETDAAASSRLWQKLFGLEFPFWPSADKTAAAGATPLKDRGFFGGV